MTIEQQYEAYLAELAAKQEEYPIYPDISWYKHTEQPDKVEEIIKYGTTIPTLEDFKKRLEEEEEEKNRDPHTEILTKIYEICYNNYRKIRI